MPILVENLFMGTFKLYNSTKGHLTIIFAFVHRFRALEIAHGEFFWEEFESERDYVDAIYRFFKEINFSASVIESIFCLHPLNLVVRKKEYAVNPVNSGH